MFILVYVFRLRVDLTGLRLASGLDFGTITSALSPVLKFAITTFASATSKSFALIRFATQLCSFHVWTS
jgi:hypothetical protein